MVIRADFLHGRGGIGFCLSRSDFSPGILRKRNENRWKVVAQKAAFRKFTDSDDSLKIQVFKRNGYHVEMQTHSQSNVVRNCDLTRRNIEEMYDLNRGLQRFDAFGLFCCGFHLDRDNDGNRGSRGTGFNVQRTSVLP
jgi:hypothetical protein